MKLPSRRWFRRPAVLGLAQGLLAFGAILPASAANPSMADDFKKIMEWQSLEMAQGLAFNAGSTFDPPQEVKGGRLQPDLSLGVGVMPLDKSKFPQLGSKTLREKDMSAMFKAKQVFPNITMHLRAGLPFRSDFSLRFTDMTTPPNYKLSPGVSGKAQSNSIGFGVRKHFFGDDKFLVSVGANYNYVFGYVKYWTKFNVNAVEGFSADSDVRGGIAWNLNSFGANFVLSQGFGLWTPFVGLGYNYATGSVRSRLEILSNTPLIAPIIGEASQHPESNQARYILGVQTNRSWVNFFSNAEIKAMGAHAGESWIIHTGFMLPFRIGPRGNSKSEVVSHKTAKPRYNVEEIAAADPIEIEDEDDWSSPIPRRRKTETLRDAVRNKTPEEMKKQKKHSWFNFMEKSSPASKPFKLDEEESESSSSTLIFIQ